MPVKHSFNRERWVDEDSNLEKEIERRHSDQAEPVRCMLSQRTIKKKYIPIFKEGEPARFLVGHSTKFAATKLPPVFNFQRQTFPAAKVQT